MPKHWQRVSHIRAMRDALRSGSEVPVALEDFIEDVLPEPRPSSTDGPSVGVMAMTALDTAAKRWAFPEVARVVDKLGAGDLVIWADVFGIRYASTVAIPYRLIGPDEPPFPTEHGWSDPPVEKLDLMGARSGATELVVVGGSEPRSAEGYRLARLQLCSMVETLVTVGGRRRLRDRAAHTNIILIDTIRRETRRIQPHVSDPIG